MIATRNTQYWMAKKSNNKYNLDKYMQLQY